MRIGGAMGAGLAVGWLAGCTVWADVDRRQCQVDSDCAQMRTGVEGLHCAAGWCIESEAGSSSSGDESTGACQSPEALVGDVGVFSATSSQRIAGAVVEVCNQLDTECTQPIVSAITNAEGRATLEVPSEFTGYLQVRADGYIPQILMGPPPLFDALPEDPELDVDNPFDEPGMVLFPLVRPQETATLALLLGTDYDPTRGVLAADLNDCYDDAEERLGFIAKTELEGASAWCLVNGLPSRTENTFVDGPCGYLNAPTGLYWVELRDRVDDRVVHEHPVIVRPSTFTTVRFR